MSKYVNEKVALEAFNEGELIGQSERTIDNEDIWWEVYQYEDKLIACMLSDESGVMCGEEITKAELSDYVG